MTQTSKAQTEVHDLSYPWNDIRYRKEALKPTSWEEVEIRQKYTDSMKETRLGKEFPWRVNMFAQVNKNTLRNVALCLGNLNPLYFDEEYAKKSPYGRLLASPSFTVILANPNAGGAGLGGVFGGTGVARTSVGQPLHGGVDYEWYRPMYIGDTFRLTGSPGPTVLKRGRKMREAYMQTGYLHFYNQYDALAARVTCWSFSSRGDALQTAQPARKHHEYTDDELRAIAEIYENEPNTIRGSNPRYWEDVQIGEELPPFVRGPIEQQDIFAWTIAGGVPGVCTAFAGTAPAVEVKDLPKWYGKALPPPKAIPMATSFLQSRTGAAISAPLGWNHIDANPRDRGGWSVPNEYAQLRAAIGMIPLSHWMGDRGFLKRMRLEYRRVHQAGDTVWYKGRVSSKEVVDGEHLVHFDYWSENQLGDITAPGLATVVLPSKG